MQTSLIQAGSPRHLAQRKKLAFSESQQRPEAVELTAPGGSNQARGDQLGLSPELRTITKSQPGGLGEDLRRANEALLSNSA